MSSDIADLAIDDVQAAERAVAEASDRVSKVTRALDAAVGEQKAIEARHARASLLAEFDSDAAAQRDELEGKVKKARARSRDLEAARPVAAQELQVAQERLLKLTAHEHFAKADAAIAARTAALEAMVPLVKELGRLYREACDKGYEAVRAAREAQPADRRDQLFSSRVMNGEMVKIMVEELMYFAGMEFTPHPGPFGAKDPEHAVARIRSGHERYLTAAAEHLPENTSFGASVLKVGVDGAA